MRKLSILLIAGGFAALAMGTFYVQADEQQEQDADLAPHGRGIGTMYEPGKPGDHFGPPRFLNPGQARRSANIQYHGGPILLGTVDAYYIWYGNWSGNSALSILPALAASIGGSPYFDINTTYYNGSGQHVSGTVHYGGSTTDNYSHGTSLSDAAIQAIVANALSSGKLPHDTNGVYFVLTSKDVNETSGFCTQYCGWHTYGTINGSNIKYAFIGNPDRCPSACEAQTASSPNGNTGADGMASIIGHELEESVTDPNLNAWYFPNGYENADKCAWTFGATERASNGSYYNMILGGREFLIQQNWVNAGTGYCALSYP